MEIIVTPKRRERSVVQFALATISTLCAVVLTGVVVWDRLGRESQGVERRPDVALEQWDTLVAEGHTIGPNTAPVTVLVFSDFECPACRAFHLNAAKPILRQFGAKVRYVHRHYPLGYHRFSRSAAVAAECAANQGRFEQFADMVFAAQDSIGLVLFSQFAERAGVTDLPGFSECIEGETASTVVEQDLAIARQLQLPGTPSVAINGSLLGVVPDSVALDSIITSHLSVMGND